jgi:geranylgeranyl reductase family protein
VTGPEICDVLIAGAGPAGSTAAFILAGQGLKVALLDRSSFPRPKLCGGLVTWKTVQSLERIFQARLPTLRSAGLIRLETRRYTVADRRGHALTRRLDDPFHLVDRTTYDAFWLGQAVSAGAGFYPDTAVVALDPHRCEVRTDDGRRWRARVVIGADGVDSRIRRALASGGNLRPPRRRGRAVALECFAPRRLGAFPDHPAIYFGKVRRGYAWSFPDPARQVLGIAALKSPGRRLQDDFRRFLRELELPEPERLRLHAHGLPYGSYLKIPGCGNTLLVGDAAGLADPFLGEGIYYAHRSAELAAHAIVAGFARPGAALAFYRESFRRCLLPEMRYAWAGRQVVFALPPRLYYPFLVLFLRLAPKIAEQTVQGRRSFRWFRLKTPCPR